ncbi:MAG TPA: DUF6603 domain-containing protein, partial [Povalibacter sp.]|nr:DUF6603 domain-containing protein [Povalibacter sp.]
MSDSGLPISGLLQRSPILGDAVNVLAPVAGLLDQVFYNDVTTTVDGDSISIWLSLVLGGALGFDLPGGFAIRFGTADDGTSLTLGARISAAGVAVTVERLAVALVIPPSLLRPAPSAPGADTPEHVELVLDGAVTFDEHRRVQVTGFESVSLARSFVGSTSIVISATDVSIDTARGLILGEARIELPPDLPQLAPEELVLDDAVIGPSGVSGKLSALYTPQFDAQAKQFVGRGSGELAGVPFAFASIEIELRDNSLIKGSFTGQLLLPFFDHPASVNITLRADNSFSIDLASDTPLATIEHEDLLRLAVEHIGFEVAGGRLIVHTGGTVTLLIGRADWPSFSASDISIDSGGHISVHGAGLVLNDGKPLRLGASPTGVGKVPGINVGKLAVSGNPLDDGLVVDAELSTVAKLGPVTGTLQQIGAHARLIVDPSGAGVAIDQLDLHSASGIGLAVDAQGVVSGGGFLFHDETQGLYAGAMQLSLHEQLTLKAFGLIATRMPDGSP